MKHLFVPYDIAVLAKEKGFNEPCIVAWNTDSGILRVFEGTVLFSNSETYGASISAPLYQQLIDWFLDKHGIFVSLVINIEDKRFAWEIFKFPEDLGNFKIEGAYGTALSSDWLTTNKYEALEAGLIEAFKLIK